MASTNSGSDVRLDELPAQVGRHAREVAAAQLARPLAVDLEAEHALEHEVGLLLALVAVDAAALAGAQPQQVEAERAQAELSAQALEAILAVEVEGCERCAGFHRHIEAPPDPGVVPQA